MSAVHETNLNAAMDLSEDSVSELRLAYADSQSKFRRLLDQMLRIAQAKNNRNPVDQNIRQTLLALVASYDRT